MLPLPIAFTFSSKRKRVFKGSLTILHGKLTAANAICTE